MNLRRHEMADGFKSLVRAPIKGCHVLKKEDIFEKITLPASMMIEADTSQGLIQAIGYLKYNLSQKGYDVVLRGQQQLYGNLKPSLFRNVGNSQDEYDVAEADFNKRILNAKKEFKKRYFEYSQKESNKKLESLQKDMYDFIDVKRQFFPPLLQHYGIKTPWLDVVDNIWVALWFSCWECDRVIPVSDTGYINQKELYKEVARYSVYHERKEIKGHIAFLNEIEKMNSIIHGQEKKMISFMLASDVPIERRRNIITKYQEKISHDYMIIEKWKQMPSYCYIILLKVPRNSKQIAQDKIRVVDLRKKIPSYYLRPHAQHALVMRRKQGEDQDLISSIAGIIRVKLEDALQWLGMGQTLSVKNLFPSPCFDHGLRKLLALKTFNQEIEIPTP